MWSPGRKFLPNASPRGASGHGVFTGAPGQKPLRVPLLLNYEPASFPAPPGEPHPPRWDCVPSTGREERRLSPPRPCAGNLCATRLCGPFHSTLFPARPGFSSGHTVLFAASPGTQRRASFLPNSSRRATSSSLGLRPFHRERGAPAFTATPLSTFLALRLRSSLRIRRRVAFPLMPA